MLQGYIDVVSTGHVEGWAIGPEHDAPLLTVSVNGEAVATVSPNIRRPDLDAIVANSFHGFRYNFAAPLKWPAVVAVTDAAGRQLGKSPAQLTEPDNCWLDNAPTARGFFSYYFIKGTGIEIGALDRPLPVAPDVKVKYVDRMDAAHLTQEYSEISSGFVGIDIVSDGQTLTGVPDGELDFVIANHVIEHMEDPTLAIKNYLRVLRPGGIIFMAVPDKRKTFDVNRPLTSIAHLLGDHDTGPGQFRGAHYQEWVDFVEGRPGDTRRAQEMDADDYSIHFHVWNVSSFSAYLDAITTTYDLPLDIRMVYPVGIEIITILQKTAAAYVTSGSDDALAGAVAKSRCDRLHHRGSD